MQLGRFSLPATRSWFEIKSADAAADATDIYVYDAIGRFGISASAFLDAILSVSSKSINLHINSPGGQVDDGIAIYNAIKDHPATVTGTVDGMCASIATVILQACDSRRMAAGSTMMIHEPYIGIDAIVVGNASDMRVLAVEAEKQASYLDKLGENTAEIYAARAGGDAAAWRGFMQAETWYRPREAVAAGLADAVIPAKSAKNALGAFNLAEFPFKNIPDWAQPPTVVSVADVRVDPVAALNRMDLPPAEKRRALDYLKAQMGVTAAA